MNYADSLGPPEPIRKKSTDEQKPVECPNCKEMFLAEPGKTTCPYCDLEFTWADL